MSDGDDLEVIIKLARTICEGNGALVHLPVETQMKALAETVLYLASRQGVAPGENNESADKSPS